MPKKFWDFFTHPSRYTGVTVLVNLLLVILAVQLHALAFDWRIFTGFALMIALLLLFDPYLKEHHERRRKRKQNSEFINRLLEAAAKSIAEVSGVQHMRACLMIVDGDYLRITNCYGFSNDDYDRDVRIAKGMGVAGRAWGTKRVVMADLHERLVPIRPGQAGERVWSLPDAEDSKIRKSLSSILSIPIMAGDPYEVIAVLNLDSDHRMKDTKFFDDHIQYIALCFYNVLASLLDKSEE